MKFTLSGILLFFVLFADCQQGSRTNLNIYAGDCRMQKHILISADTLWLYRQDTLVQKTPLSIGEGVRDPIVIHNLLPGQYRLAFVNIYGQHIDKSISIPDSGDYTCRICPDQLGNQRLNTLSRLKIGESINLRFKETSCFGDGEARLRITRKEGYYIAHLQDHENGVLRRLTVKLTRQMESDFTSFENELRYLKDGGRCTTQDYYTIESKYGTFTKRDGFCNWTGFYLLKRAFFGDID